MASLDLDHLHKAYGASTIVHDISCSIHDGEFIVIVGPSGCGKSTLLRMIAGLEPVTSGRVLIDGRDVTETDPAQRGIAMVFQSYALYPHMTVRDNMSFGLRNLKRGKAEIQTRVDEAAQLLRLTDHLDRLPSQLSGGQRQRVAIGRAIVREPRIFLFDEPLSNLDAELRVQMRRELAKLHQRLGSTMVYVTHDQTEAMTLADRIVLLDQGRIVQFGTPLEIYNAPNCTFAAKFVGSPKINLIDARVEAGAGDEVLIHSALGQPLRLSRSSLASDLPSTVTLGIRPEHLQLTPASGALQFPMNVGTVEVLGDCCCIYGNVEDGTELAIKVDGQVHMSSGQAITAFAACENILIFKETGERIADDIRVSAPAADSRPRQV